MQQRKSAFLTSHWTSFILRTSYHLTDLGHQFEHHTSYSYSCYTYNHVTDPFMHISLLLIVYFMFDEGLCACMHASLQTFSWSGCGPPDPWSAHIKVTIYIYSTSWSLSSLTGQCLLHVYNWRHATSSEIKGQERYLWSRLLPLFIG